jgi:hypothetical protein
MVVAVSIATSACGLNVCPCAPLRVLSFLLSQLLQLKLQTQVTCLLLIAAYAVYLCLRSLLAGTCTLNITSSTLFCTTLASVLQLSWATSDLVQVATLNTVAYEFRDFYAIPIFSIFQANVLLQFPLMWLQIAAKAKKLEHAGRNLSRNATGGVVVVCLVVSACFVAFSLIGRLIYTSLSCAVIYVVMIVVYTCAAGKLESALGTTGTRAKTGKAIANLSRRIAMSLLLGVISMGVFFLCGNLWSVANASIITAFLPTIVVVGIQVRRRPRKKENERLHLPSSTHCNSSILCGVLHMFCEFGVQLYSDTCMVSRNRPPHAGFLRYRALASAPFLGRRPWETEAVYTHSAVAKFDRDYPTGCHRRWFAVELCVTCRRIGTPRARKRSEGGVERRRQQQVVAAHSRAPSAHPPSSPREEIMKGARMYAIHHSGIDTVE